jgi:hypothetical protein
MSDNLPAVYDEKDVAYQIWAYLANRNATRTAEIMKAEPGPGEDSDRPPYPNVSARTIRDWVTRLNWHERLERDIKTVAPGIHAHISQEILVASVHAIVLARDIVEGKVEASDKVRLDAAKTILDRAGHMPWVRPSDNSRPSGPVRDYSESAAGMTPDELAARLFGPKPDQT